MSAQSTQARDIPGLTRVRMLMHELKGDELQEIAALDLWSATGCGLLRESSAAADSARNAVLSTFRQTWPVAREVFTANGPSAAGAERGLQSKDISTLALGFIQGYILMLYIAEGGQCSVAASDNFLQAATIEVAESCLSELSRQSSTDAPLERLAEGFSIVCGLAKVAARLTMVYTAALTSLATAATNRRKLFSLGASKVLPSYLIAPADLDRRLRERMDDLLAACMLEEKHIDELCKGPLSEAIVAILCEDQFASLSSREETRQKAQGKEDKSGVFKRQAVYTSELFNAVSAAFGASGRSMDTGIRRLLQLFIAHTMGKLSDGTVIGQHHESAITLHRRACAQVLHFALSLLETCSGFTYAKSGNDVFAGEECEARVRCRCAILDCLSDLFGATAIPDHPSLSRYTALLRTTYTAVLSDLTSAALIERFDPAAGSRGISDYLLSSLKCLVCVDHRPVVASSPSVALIEKDHMLSLILGHLQALGGSVDGLGAKELLISLIRLHQDLRLMPNLITATFASISNNNALGSTDTDWLCGLLNSDEAQIMLVRSTRAMPAVQLQQCWSALNSSFFASMSTDISDGCREIGAKKALLLLRVWIKPLVLAYLHSDGSSRGHGVLSDVPLGSDLLPLLLEMQRRLIDELHLTSLPATDRKIKSKKRKASVALSNASGSGSASADLFKMTSGVLEVVEGLSRLIAMHAPHASALTTLHNPAMNNSQPERLLEWRAVYEAAMGLFKRLSDPECSVWVCLPSHVAPMQAMSCGMSLFSLLVTTHAVTDKSIVLKLQCGVKDMTGAVDLDGMLAGLLNAAKGEDALSVGMSALILRQLAVWSHLLYRVDKCKEQNACVSTVAALTEQCFRVISTFLLLHIENGSSTTEDTDMYRELLEILNSAAFLEHKPLLDSLHHCLCHIFDSAKLRAFSDLLLQLPLEVSMICLTSTRSVLEDLQLAVTNGLSGQRNESLKSPVRLLASYYCNSGGCLQGMDSLELLRVTLSAEPECVSSELQDLVQAIVDNILQRGDDECSVALVACVLNAGRQQLREIDSPPTVGRTSMRVVKNVENTRGSAVFLHVLRCVCNAVVTTITSRAQTNTELVQHYAHDIYVAFRVFVEDFLAACQIDEATGLPTVDDMAGLLDAGDVVLGCARVIVCVRCLGLDGTDNIYLSDSLFKNLYNKIAYVFRSLVCWDCVSVRRGYEVPRSRMLHCIAICSLLIQAAENCAIVVTMPTATETLQCVVRLALDRDSEGGEDVLRAFYLATRSILLTVREPCHLHMLCHQTLAGLSRTHTKLRIFFVEALVQSVLDHPSRLAVGASGPNEASVVSVMMFACSALQDISCESIDLLATAVQSWHKMLTGLQRYQQQRVRAKHAGSSRGAKRKRKLEIKDHRSSHAEGMDQKHGGDLLNARLMDIIDLWAVGCLRASSDWLCRIGVASASLSKEKTTIYGTIEKILRLVELAVIIQSETRLNTAVSVLAAILRAVIAALCSHAVLEQQGHMTAERDSLNAAVRQCSRLLAGLASCRPLQKYIHLMAAITVDVMALYPSVCNSTAALGGAVDDRSPVKGIDMAPMMAGLFCMFDRCRTSKQRLQMFAALGRPEARLLMSDLHEIYLREYKFVGLA